MSIIANSIASIGLTKGPYAVASVGYLARQDAPSGMHRLMLYQLQEEHLKKEAEKKTIQVAAKEVAEKIVKPTKKVVKKVKKAKQEEPIERLPPFKLAPVKAPEETDILPILKLWSDETYSWVLSINPLLSIQAQVIIFKQNAAANDAEYRLRLLLLAA